MESLNKPSELPKCPREKANLLSFLTFFWVLPVFFKGKTKTLGLEDLYQPLMEQKAELLGEKLENSWKKKQNLMSCLVDVFGLTVLGQGLILLFLECGIKILPPIFLSRIISFYSNPDGRSQNEAVWYSIGIICSMLANILILHSFNVSNLNQGFIMKTGVCSLIYRKCLRLSKISIGKVTTGKIVNMMSTDAGKFESVVLWMHYLWVGPLQTVIVTALMFQEIGFASFVGVFVLVAFMPVQLYLGKKTSQLRFETARRTDKRVQLMNEIIQGIQVIKMYAWEKPFNKVVSTARLNETKLIRYYSWIRGILLSFITFSSLVSIFSSLVMYALMGNVVTAQKAFVVIAYFNVLRYTMIVMYPFAINFTIDCSTSVSRINDFLINYADLETKFTKNPDESPKVSFENVTARWGGESQENTLSNINLDVESPLTVAVIGKIGAGKSSLIQAVLGELPILKGKVQVNGTVAYAAQEPWLFSGSIRQNILFGEPMNKDRYQAVIKACSLTRDIELWPEGDETVVGERGMSLSGGQKARINLARAVYRKADIYLLDDPLSAVDAHVGRHLFDSCIKDFLKDKLVILVTHQLQYLPTADQILLLTNGTVEGVGTFERLRDSGLDFANLLPKEEVEDPKDLTRSVSKESGKYKRQESVASVKSKKDEVIENHAVKKQTEEKRAEGSVGLSHYKSYFQAAGGYSSTLIVIGFFALAQLSVSSSDYFVSFWVRQEEANSKPNENDDTSYNRNLYIYIFTALTTITVLITLSRSFLFFNVAMRASRQLHDAMFAGVTHATMHFFNTNPSGRILNRFSKDVGQIDETLPFILVDVFQVLFAMLGTMAVLAVVNPFFLIPMALLFAVFYVLRNFYLKTSLDIKRLQATTRSPIFSHLTESLNGLATVRSFNAEKVLIQEFDSHQDLNTSAFYLFCATSRAFGFWLDLCCLSYIAIVVFSFFLMLKSGGNVGLAITQAMSLTGLVQLGIKQTAALENTMTAVERVAEYNDVDPEPAFESSPDKKPPKEWPENGEIKFEKLSLSYFPDSDEKVLKNLNFEILPNEKIGIVGRTGAGKSSIVNALFRLSYNEGQIIIDARDTQAIGLHELRSKISIIPQEPVLFSGSMRYNLDPFDEYPDEKLWSALEEVKMKQFINQMPAGLMTKISEGGDNFSVGQRQLVCLARAILRENKILLMDEATANVDPQTDALIQTTIRQKFANCTVLTIAHRLNTVMDSDRILVMDAGRCIEFASPHELLSKSNGSRVFYNMLKETGKATFESLRKVAEKSHLEKKID